MQPNSVGNGGAQPVSPVRPVNPVSQAKPVEPVKPAAPASGPAFDNGPSVVEPKGGRKTGWIIGLVLMALIAAGGVGFGVWAWMDGNTQKDALNEQISDLKKQNGELLDKLAEQETEVEEETEVQDLVDDYIYVEEWGLKIKKPENSLGKVWYEFNEETSQSAAALYISEKEAGLRIVVYKVIDCSTQRSSDQKCFAVDDMYYVVQVPNADETISEEFIEHFSNQESYSSI